MFFMLIMNLPVVDTVLPQTNKLSLGLRMKATGNLELNEPLVPDTENVVTPFTYMQ